MSSLSIDAVISVFPDLNRTEMVRSYLSQIPGDWEHWPISGTTATNMLDKGELLRQALGRRSYDIRLGQDLEERQAFSEQALECLALKMPDEGRFLIVAPSLVPFDLVQEDNRAWGLTHIFSHLLTDKVTDIHDCLRRSVQPIELHLDSYLLVCPMAMDRAVPRHLQDIVTVAASLEKYLPVEIWLQPTLPRAISALERRDVSWLHIDTHGDSLGSAIMMGPTRSGSNLVGTGELPNEVYAPLVLPIGCALLATSNSVGTEFIKRGAYSVFGPCSVFHSLGIANSEEGEANWYRNFFTALLDGVDVGESVRRARQVSGGGILKFAWMILGTSALVFAK